MRERYPNIVTKVENLLNRVDSMTAEFSFLTDHANRIRDALSNFDRLDVNVIMNLDNLVDHVNEKIDMHYTHYENHQNNNVENATPQVDETEEANPQAITMLVCIFRVFENAYNIMRNIFNHAVHAVHPELIVNDHQDNQNFTIAGDEVSNNIQPTAMLHCHLEGGSFPL